MQQQREAFLPPWTTGLETHTEHQVWQITWNTGQRATHRHTDMWKPSTRWWVPPPPGKPRRKKLVATWAELLNQVDMRKMKIKDLIIQNKLD